MTNTLFTSTTIAQNNTEFETWKSFQLDFRVGKKWNFSLEEQIRFNFNDGKTSQIFTQFNTDYSIFKKLKLSVGFRYIGENDYVGKIKEFENHFRYNIDLQHNYGIGRIKIKHRFRFQNANELGKSIYQGDYPDKNFRIKTTLLYDFKNWKLDPFSSLETFFHQQIGAINGYDKFRITIGTSYKISKRAKLDFILLREKQYRIWNPKKTIAYKFRYTYTFKK